MSSRNIDDLLPHIAKKAHEFLVACKAAGLDVLVTCTVRSLKEQAELYEQGRTMPGLIVTHAMAGQSWHNFGRAFDVVILINGKPDWEVKRPELWERLGALGEAYCFEWGGRWIDKKKDMPHFQLTEGKTLGPVRKILA